MKTASATDIVKQAWHSLKVKDLDKFAELIDEDVIFELPLAPPGTPKLIQGKAAFEANFRHLNTALIKNGERYDLEFFPMEDPRMVAITGKTRIEMYSGKLYENDYCWIITVKDGRISKYLEYNNPLSIMKAFDDDGPFPLTRQQS
jgi:ketosteroid isomerase-like protein